MQEGDVGTKSLYIPPIRPLSEKIRLDVTIMSLCEGKNYLVIAKEDLSSWVEI
jgi:hypothetical protein